VAVAYRSGVCRGRGRKCDHLGCACFRLSDVCLRTGHHWSLLSHVGEIVGARPGNATAVVFRACTSCRSVFLSVHNISVAYASSVRIPIVLYIPTPQRVFGRRVVMTAARSTSVPHSGVAAGEDALLVSVCVCVRMLHQRRTCGALQHCTILI